MSQPCSAATSRILASAASRLRAVAGVDEHVRRIGGDDQAVAEHLLEVVAELAGRQTLGQRVRPAVLAQLDLQSPVIGHGHQTIAEGCTSGTSGVRSVREQRDQRRWRDHGRGGGPPAGRSARSV